MADELSPTFTQTLCIDRPAVVASEIPPGSVPFGHPDRRLIDAVKEAISETPLQKKLRYEANIREWFAEVYTLILTSAAWKKYMLKALPPHLANCVKESGEEGKYTGIGILDYTTDGCIYSSRPELKHSFLYQGKIAFNDAHALLDTEEMRQNFPADSYLAGFFLALHGFSRDGVKYIQVYIQMCQ